jgi:hypothetical protein
MTLRIVRPRFAAQVAGALVLAALPAMAAAHDPIDTSGYPELAPQAMLPVVIASLKHSLRDPHSIQDFTICRPYKLSLKNGKPHTWAIMLSFNSRNGLGGYDGVSMYAAAFKDGVVNGDIAKVQMSTNRGLDRMINSAIAKDMRGCVSVPDAEVERLLRAAP